MPSSSENLRAVYARLVASEDLHAAAECLIQTGRLIGMPHPAVIDDYSSSRLITVADGRALTSVLGWDSVLVDQWIGQRLHLVSPIAAVCRLSTQPFSWDAAAITRTVLENAGEPEGSPALQWPLTPEQGFYGGITVPVHLPGGRTGSVSWYARDPAIDVAAALARHGDHLRLVAHRFMDLVWAVRAESASTDAEAPLSEREIECLTWAALGRTDSEIGAVIHRSPTTARFHIDNAVRKLGARNRTQAVAIAALRGLIHPEPPNASSTATTT